ncbi:MAG: SDR family oxidoreductase [Flavobacteriales bacterium]
MSYELLKEKNGLVFGALDENSIAWKVAECAYQEGASFVLSNAPIALRMGKIDQLAKKTQAVVIPADATSMEDLGKLFDETLKYFDGKIDFILHAIGMSINVRKDRSYTDLNYDWLHKGWDISAVSFHKVMKTAWDKDAMNEWGSIVALTYIAGQRSFPDYNDMADHKSYLESVARNFGYHWGLKCKVRVNTVSQSPTPTTAGKGVKGFDGFLRYAEALSPLGNASARDCAEYVITLFSDLTKRVTMQNLYHDGGFSTTGISEAVMKRFMSEN